MSLVEKVYRNYGDFILEVNNWTIADQGISVLWGSSGAGKSSLVRCLLGLDPQAEVVWKFGTENLGALPVEKRNLGVVFQEPALFPHMMAKSNILFPIKRKSKASEQLFDLLVEHMELEDHLDKPVLNLSGGQQQRVAIARALIYQPRLLLLDEPFSSLDEAVRKKTRAMVKSVTSTLKIPVLLITHDRQDVLELASEVHLMKDGSISEKLSVAQFQQNC